MTLKMKKECKLNDGKSILDVIITQEKIGSKTFFVAQGIQVEVASQGLSLEEALENIKDAATIVLENSKEAQIENTENEIAPMITRIFL
ncbi:MAG: hypothetical protein AABW47_02190 [Nanoarchaeota archaeon]